MRGINLDESELIKIELLRGHSNRFFFAERELSSETDVINAIVLRFKRKDNQWTCRPRTIYTSTTGKILTFKLEENYPKDTDSYWSYDNSLEVNKEILNQLFVLDSMLNLVHLR